jgi:hypothetical protein
MGQRSKITQLPEDVRAELERRLVQSSFSNYDALARWLSEKGFEVHRSSVYRYGAPFEKRLKAMQAATQQARAIVEATPDDEGAMSEALMRLCQEKVFDILLQIDVDPETVDLHKLTRSVADMQRASVTLRRYQAQVRDRAKAAADALDKAAAGAGGRITQETLDRIRSEIYGIAG